MCRTLPLANQGLYYDKQRAAPLSRATSQPTSDGPRQHSMTNTDIPKLREQNYNSTVATITQCNPDLMILRVQPDFAIPSHKPGQYTTLGLGYWEERVPDCQEETVDPASAERVIRRAYSLSNSILNDQDKLLDQPSEWLEFYIVLVRDAQKEAPPALTPRLFSLKEGDRLHVGEKITGRFTLDPVKPEDTVIFLSTGTGEAPHNYMLWELLRNGHRGKLLSACCVRYLRDLGYRAVHDKLMQMHPNYTYVGLTTREKENVGNKIYLQDLITTGQLEEKIGVTLDANSTHVFLCGNPNMIGVPKVDRETGELTFPETTGVIEILSKRGFQIDLPSKKIVGNIHFEEYW